MQFLPIVAVFSALLFSVSLASESKGRQLDDAELNSIVDFVVNKMAKAVTKSKEPIVEGLGRKRRTRCEFVQGKSKVNCHFISSQAQMKVPETGELIPVEVSFDLKGTQDDQQQQQPKKIKNLSVEGIDIKMLDDQKPVGPHLVWGFGMRFRKYAIKALKKTAKEAIKERVDEELTFSTTELP